MAAGLILGAGWGTIDRSAKHDRWEYGVSRRVRTPAATGAVEVARLLRRDAGVVRPITAAVSGIKGHTTGGPLATRKSASAMPI